MTLTRHLRAVAATFILTLVLHAAAAEAGDWRWSITPYAWATDIGVDARLGGSQVVDATIPVSDLLEDLDTIVQLRAEGQTGRYGVLLDLFDVTLSDAVEAVALPEGTGTADVASDLGMTLLDVAGFMDAGGDPRTGMAFLAGARVLDERATIDATMTGAAGAAATKRWDSHDTMVDALVGLRMRLPLARRWALQGQLDASAGATDHTWSAGSALLYLFGRHAVSAGYRTMDVDFADEHGLDTRMTLSGVLVGFRTSF